MSRRSSRDPPPLAERERWHRNSATAASSSSSQQTARRRAKTNSGIPPSEKPHPPLPPPAAPPASSTSHQTRQLRTQSIPDVPRSKGTDYPSDARARTSSVSINTARSRHDTTLEFSRPRFSTSTHEHWLERPVARDGEPVSPRDVTRAEPDVTRDAEQAIGTASDMPEINIAVVGAAGVGKSTFIQRALALRGPSTGILCKRKMCINGVIYAVCLIELELEYLDLDEARRIRWPTRLNDLDLPRIHGALVCYESQSERSIASVPRILSVMATAGLPFVLVRCKCDLPPAAPQDQDTLIVDAEVLANRVDCFETSVTLPDSQKRCVGACIRRVRLLERTEPPEELARRRRAISSGSSSLRPSSKHDRPIGESSRSTAQSLNAGSCKVEPSEANADATPTSRSGYENSVIAPSQHRGPSAIAAVAASDPSGSVQAGRNVKFTIGTIPEHALSTKLAVVSDVPFKPSDHTVDSPTDENMQSIFKDPDYASPILPGPDDELGDGGRREHNASAGETLEDLVHRLLSRPSSKSDANFASIFLCLYRKFAAPGRVLDLILLYFGEVDDDDDEQKPPTSSQLRHLGVLSQWVLGYPGDFSSSDTRRRLKDFLARLPNTRPFAAATKDMLAVLDVAHEDDDAGWGKSDVNAGSDRSPPTSRSRGVSRSVPPETTVEDLEASMGDVSLEFDGGRNPARISGAPSNASSAGNSTTLSAGSSQTLFNTAELAEREAQLLTPSPRRRLSKTEWHQFMELNDDEFAEELTRIDWIMFSAIRPRDLVRHVSLSTQQKETCRNLENVNRWINQFNHVAAWVTNMILLRDKPKHRARALEKFMNIAWKLRYLNNYNSLGAVIAGINCNPVFRLIQTREMVNPKAQKDFMRLEILMGTQKGHFAYRLAWSNTSSPRIPFLPLHRRDLISGEEGNRTFCDEHQGRINWKKFEVIGDVIVSIQRSQAMPYRELVPRLDAQRLVLDSEVVKDDDDLYDRSIELESSGASAGDTAMRRKFSWFQR